MERPAINKQSNVTLKKADRPQQLNTFDVSKVKSTVTNPSQKFKGISVEDEQKIYDLVNKNYPNWSNFEKQQATQWYYSSALKAQKKKDIEAWRNDLKLKYQYMRDTAKDESEKNKWNTQLKRADLADLIRQELGNVPLNITDNWVIDDFLERNPMYNVIFDRYYYDKRSAADLGRDLWWIEPEDTTWQQDVEKWAANVWRDYLWWIPKLPEWLKELWQLWDSLAWYKNYVKDRYWVKPENLSPADKEHIREDWENVENKDQYEPGVWNAITKTLMWWADTAYTLWTMWLWKYLAKKWVETAWKEAAKAWWEKVLKNNAFKLGFAAAAETPWTSRAPEALWDTLSFIWENINKLPGFKDIRDSLKTEQDKADWDAFVAWNVLDLARTWKKNFGNISYKDMEMWKSAFDDIFKKWQFREGIDTIKAKSAENALAKRQKKFGETKKDIAQQITQLNSAFRESAAKWFDILNEEWALDNLKNIDDLEKNVVELRDTLKEEQTQAAENTKKRYWNSQLSDIENVPELDKYGNKKMTPKSIPVVWDLLNKLIDYYDNVDKAEADKYRSYKAALDNWYLPADALLEAKREGNHLSKSFSETKGTQSDTQSARNWSKLMTRVNNVVEWLDMWEDIRTRDAKLSALYTIEKWIKMVKDKANDYKKNLVRWAKSVQWVWWVAWKMLGRIMLTASNVLSMLALSMAEETFKWEITKKKYNPVEIRDRVTEFIDDYKKLDDKIKNWGASTSTLEKLANGFINKWNLEAQYNEEEDK